MNSSNCAQHQAFKGAVQLPGLKIKHQGLAGAIVELTDDFQIAVNRHAALIRVYESCPDAPSGALILFSLVINDAVLSMNALKAATSIHARTYADGEKYYLEIRLPGGWLDRRIISKKTFTAIEENRGAEVKSSDWKWVAKTFKSLHAIDQGINEWQLLLSDAQAWWYPNLTGPMFAHATRITPFQLLPRVALARLSTGLAQLPECGLNTSVSQAFDLIQVSFKAGKDIAIIEELISFIGFVARERGDKAAGRAKIIERIQMLLPVAANLGRSQLIVLGALEHALSVGGVSGRLWSPITMYDYTCVALADLTTSLLENTLEEMDGERFHKIYTELLSKVATSQRAKFAAFLQAIHRFLVICGFDPLPWRLHYSVERIPPAAAVVSPNELKLAIEYVQAVAPTPRIVLQATLGLTLAFHVPLRTEELWCIRRCDVHTRRKIYVDIYPRQRDGVGKTPSLRRQVDIHDPDLQKLLLDMVALRDEDEDDEDEVVLLGEPQQPNVRHAQALTTKLMNDALKWATGNSSASFYDLRHSVFTRRANEVIGGVEQ